MNIGEAWKPEMPQFPDYGKFSQTEDCLFSQCHSKLSLCIRGCRRTLSRYPQSEAKVLVAPNPFNMTLQLHLEGS